MRSLFLLFSTAALTACGFFTDAATRVAFDIEAGVRRLGAEEGASYTIRHATPSRPGDCGGPFKIQFDKVGALIIWCKDTGGQVVASHSTSYHARFVDTPRTYIIDKPAESTLLIRIERHQGRAVITDVL